MLSMNQEFFKTTEERTLNILRDMDNVNDDEFFKAFANDLNSSESVGFLSSFFINELFGVTPDSFVETMSDEGVNCFVIEQTIGSVSNKVIFGVMFDENLERLQESIAVVNSLAKSMPGLLGVKNNAPFKFQQ